MLSLSREGTFYMYCLTRYLKQLKLPLLYRPWNKQSDQHQANCKGQIWDLNLKATELQDRLSIPNPQTWKLKCYSIQNLLNTVVKPVSGKFNTWPHAADGSQNLDVLKILCKITFRLCVWGVYEIKMNFLLRLGSHLQGMSLCMCKYSKIWKNPEQISFEVVP
jgi:hypothetical protein